jgi:hypothetical protein
MGLRQDLSRPLADRECAGYVGTLVMMFLTNSTFQADGDVLLMKGSNLFNPGGEDAPRRSVPRRLSAIIQTVRSFTAATDCIAMVLLPATLWIANRQHNRAAVEAVKSERCGLRGLLLATIVMDKVSTVMIYWKVGRQTESRFWAAPCK